MSRSSTFPTLNGSKRPTALIFSGVLAGLAALGLAVPDRALGQSGALEAWEASSGRGPPLRSRSRSRRRSPIQVFQRDANGRATIPIELDEAAADAKVLDASAMPAREGSAPPGSEGMQSSPTASSSASRSAVRTRLPLTVKKRQARRHRSRRRRSSSATSGSSPASRTWRASAT